MRYKKSVLTASMAVFLCAGSAQAQDVLTGDTRLACEAILCLSSGVRPGECSPSLERYFGISHKYWSDTVRGRINFLNLCPSGNEIGMPELIDAIGHGAGRCDSEFLNRHNKKTIKERRCSGSPINRTCNIVERLVIDDELPKYCGVYQNHEWTYRLNVKYVGVPELGGKWVEAKDYEQALQEYNDKRKNPY